MRAQTVENLERGQRVEVYRNLHTGRWSVRDCATGLVVAHVDACSLFDAKLVVQPAGRQRVIDQGRKNVHAFVRGYLHNPTPAWTLLRRYMRPITYNPYRYTSFVYKDTCSPIHSADIVTLSGSGVMAYQAPQENDALLAEMVYWLHDCDIDTTDATAHAIKDMVERAYEGGVDQFLMDG